MLLLTATSPKSAFLCPLSPSQALAIPGTPAVVHSSGLRALGAAARSLQAPSIVFLLRATVSVTAVGEGDTAGQHGRHQRAQQSMGIQGQRARMEG